MKTELSTALESAKRNCHLCYTYKNFRPKEEYKVLAHANADKSYMLLGEAFQQIRKTDASVQKMDAIRDARTLCLKAMDLCKTCQKESPKIKETLLGVHA